jgi:hypothetical protein
MILEKQKAHYSFFIIDHIEKRCQGFVHGEIVDGYTQDYYRIMAHTHTPLTDDIAKALSYSCDGSLPADV